jgi:adenine-specific DNA-methyltransferase
MSSNFFPKPLPGELPSRFADRVGREYASAAGPGHKKDKGQFFTPVEIADFMAASCTFKGKTLRLLDPGCGTAVLSCALIEKLVEQNPGLSGIELTAYETDPQLVQLTRPVDLFDVVISNPPYFKLSIEDKRAIAGKVVVNGHPNIYAIFMALGARLLKEGGELIIITPRSYASGGYFKAFREFFFPLIEVDHIHLFVSRKETFGRDQVLQETVIHNVTRDNRTDPEKPVLVTSSADLKDLVSPAKKIFPKRAIIDLDTAEKILYLPTSDEEEAILGIFREWTGRLRDYGTQISTGPVVAFRAVNFIRESAEKGSAPLFWLHHVKQMALEWPLEKLQKGQYITVESGSRALLLPNKNYVLLRRFSSKDDKNRLVAARYFSDFTDAEFIGVENKLNYIYRPKGHLEHNEVIGLSALLNSSLFDAFFRIFNGNGNVSATELREMPMPPLEIIREIGEVVILSKDLSPVTVNKVVMEYFDFKTFKRFSNDIAWDTEAWVAEIPEHMIHFNGEENSSVPKILQKINLRNKFLNS